MLIPKPIGRWLRANLPGSVKQGLMALYTPYHQWAVHRVHGRALRLLVPIPPGLVQAGPFRGMKYADPALRGVYASKYVGAYEQELNPTVETIAQQNYTTVINVGCAEGYYAVGLALRLPNAKVYAFDTDVNCQNACSYLARLNNLEKQVVIRGTCTANDLDPLIQGKTLVVSDCEGYENELLEPVRAPRLKDADILVELHKVVRPGTKERILSRFSASHRIEIIGSTERKPQDYPVLAALSPGDAAFVLDEQRGERMEWGFLTSLGTKSEKA